MIVISFGVRKSGSTLALEIARAVLELNGYPQTRLPDEIVNGRSEVNKVDQWTDDVLTRLVDHTAETKIAIRTHAAPSRLSVGRILDAFDAGDLRIHVVFRDPRDTVLSMLDERGRKGRPADFDEVTTRLRANLRNLRRWGSLPSLKLQYEAFAFDPAVAPTLIAEDLGLHADPEEVWSRVSSRHTRRNVVEPHRYRRDMSPEDVARIDRAFPDYLALIEDHDRGWFHRAAPDPGPLPWDRPEG